MPGLVFVLTTTELHTVFVEPDTQTEASVSIGLASITTDMRSFFETGLVAWATSADCTYILTADGLLTLLPVRQEGDTVVIYHARIDLGGAKMTWYDGFVFVANSAGDLLVMSFEPDGTARPRTVRLQPLDDGSDFFVRGGRLFFGHPDGPGVALIPHGPLPDDVELTPMP